MRVLSGIENGIMQGNRFRREFIVSPWQSNINDILDKLFRSLALSIQTFHGWSFLVSQRLGFGDARGATPDIKMRLSPLVRIVSKIFHSSNLMEVAPSVDSVFEFILRVTF